MAQSTALFVGLDVDKDSIAVGHAGDRSDNRNSKRESLVLATEEMRLTCIAVKRIPNFFRPFRIATPVVLNVLSSTYQRPSAHSTIMMSQLSCPSAVG